MSDLFRIYFQDGSYRFCRWIRSDVKEQNKSKMTPRLSAWKGGRAMVPFSRVGKGTVCGWGEWKHIVNIHISEIPTHHPNGEVYYTDLWFKREIRMESLIWVYCVQKTLKDIGFRSEFIQGVWAEGAEIWGLSRAPLWHQTQSWKRRGWAAGEAYFPLDYGQIIHQVAVCVNSHPESLQCSGTIFSLILAHDRL